MNVFLERLAKKKWFVPLVILLMFGISVSSLLDLREEKGSMGTESRIEDICNSVAGVSDAKVMITYEPIEVSTFNKSEGEKVSGIAVVCSGGGRPEVQLSLYQILKSLYGISSTRITIAERN